MAFILAFLYRRKEDYCCRTLWTVCTGMANAEHSTLVVKGRIALCSLQSFVFFGC